MTGVIMYQYLILRRAALACTMALILGASFAYSSPAAANDLGREILAKNDGWGSYGPGVTGGSTANTSHVFEVSTWQELRAALGGTRAHNETTPRIIYVKGTINAMAKEGG
jgi:pectate lyase